MASEQTFYNVIRQYGPGYGVPLILFNAAVVAWVFGRPLIEVGAAMLIALVWLLGYSLLRYRRNPLVLAGIALALLLLGYWLLSYFFLRIPPTGRSRLRAASWASMWPVWKATPRTSARKVYCKHCTTALRPTRS